MEARALAEREERKKRNEGKSSILTIAHNEKSIRKNFESGKQTDWKRKGIG